MGKVELRRNSNSRERLVKHGEKKRHFSGTLRRDERDKDESLEGDHSDRKAPTAIERQVQRDTTRYQSRARKFTDNSFEEIGS